MDIPRALQHLRPGSQWTLNGDSYDGLQWFGPGQPPTLAELEQAWAEIQSVKIWPTIQQFMECFTMSEKAAIGLSTDPTIAALRIDASTWLTPVHSNDSRVVMGLDKMVELGIISADRKTEIITI